MPEKKSGHELHEFTQIVPCRLSLTRIKGRRDFGYTGAGTSRGKVLEHCDTGAFVIAEGKLQGQKGQAALVLAEVK